MKRRTIILSVAGLGMAAGLLAVPRHWRSTALQLALDPNPAPPPPEVHPFAAAEPWATKLIAAAESQIGVTIRYDGHYEKIPYPGGDVPMTYGVCTDVVIRAYRAGLAIDLQQHVHQDMQREFSAYPHRWGLTRPDSNIDHRRVPNLQTYLTRQGASLPVTASPADYRPGDLVTMLLPGRLPHIAIVSHHPSSDGARPLCLHNIGAGTRLDDVLFAYDLDGHFRFSRAT